MAPSVTPGAGSVYQKPTQSTWVTTDPYQGYDVNFWKGVSGYQDVPNVTDASGKTSNRLYLTGSKDGYTYTGKGTNPYYGWVDPSTGQINYAGAGNQYSTDANGKVTAKDNTFQYNADTDYGLGVPGVIPMARDPKTGMVTKFFAMSGGGGGTVFDDLATAQAAAASYGSWKKNQDERYAAPGAGAVTTAPNTDTSTGLGTQNVPGANEEWYTNHAAQFDQPTNSEQLWNKYSGQFGNWDSSGLGGVIDREQARAQGLMDRRAASKGYGDSGAMTRSTMDLGLRYGDKKLTAMQDWAKTGMGLAGSADTGQYTRLGMGEAASRDAQSAKLLRESSGLNSAINLGNALAGTATSGLNQADQTKLDLYMQGLSAQMQKGGIDANTALAQAQDWMALNKIALNPTTLAYVSKALSGGGGTSSGLGPTYTTRTINY